MGSFDWGFLFSTVSGLISLGAVGSIVFFRYRKKSEKLKPQDEGMDIVDKATKKTELLVDEVGKWHDKVNQLYNESVEMRKEIGDLKYQVLEQNRKISGVQDTLKRQIGRKKYAERRICTVLDCTLRRPPFGSFTSEDGDSLERYVNLNNRVRKGHQSHNNDKNEQTDIHQ